MEDQLMSKMAHGTIKARPISISKRISSHAESDYYNRAALKAAIASVSEDEYASLLKQYSSGLGITVSISKMIQNYRRYVQ